MEELRATCAGCGKLWPVHIENGYLAMVCESCMVGWKSTGPIREDNLIVWSPNREPRAVLEKEAAKQAHVAFKSDVYNIVCMSCATNLPVKASSLEKAIHAFKQASWIDTSDGWICPPHGAAWVREKHRLVSGLSVTPPFYTSECLSCKTHAVVASCDDPQLAVDRLTSFGWVSRRPGLDMSKVCGRSNFVSSLSSTCPQCGKEGACTVESIERTLSGIKITFGMRCQECGAHWRSNQACANSEEPVTWIRSCVQL